jgi:hypothetical protein
MAILLLIFFASAVLTVLFWASAVAVALALLHLILALVKGIFWLITRPIVWLVIMPLQLMFGGSQKPSPKVQQSSFRTINSTAGSSTDKLQQLAKLKNLLDGGTITTAEFEQLKADLFQQS